MIPSHVRVAAIDNNKSDLEKIYAGLAKAGYWVMPFHYDAGQLEPDLPAANNGVRIIFSDIHLVEGQMYKMVPHAQALINCLKKIVSEGPYIVIFWTSHPADAEEMIKQVRQRMAREDETPPPVYFGSIDKTNILNGTNDDFDPAHLVTLINEEVAKCGPLLLSISWEERVFQAAVRSTHRLFNLAANGLAEEAEQLSAWHKLLGFLAKEASGQEAQRLPVKAMDLALLPLLEDRLQTSSIYAHQLLQNMLASELGAKPQNITGARLNTHYLVEIIKNPDDVLPSGRGVVSLVDIDKWDDTYSVRFDGDWRTLVENEFLFSNQNEAADVSSLMKPCLVTLTPECDDVQGKVGSYRYLFGVFFKKSDVGQKKYYSSKGRQYKNLSVFEVGSISVEENGVEDEYVLLISCNRFLAQSTQPLHVKSIYRLRRSVIEELTHHYTTHARRPGVMRFRD